ncbi:hypothetical protein HWV23_05945 [Natronomonas halophila]|uniref:hypothetical protein n=1 Tax=Natronomonas halophila TaxID=2747817 RepID=UPI0015B44DA0|nr:hypothetical protein [Natronomonas halophila]QLD85287.1 hypothetical protein HWV23_05945 [Natronomonas halophila]
MPSIRSIAVSLLAGLLHAAALLVVALELGYAVGPAEYSLLGAAWRYGGLVVLAAVPVWLAVRHRLVTPLVALVLTTGYVLGMELTPPGPTFRDVAELEGLAEPTGYIVVENGLYIVRYMVNASVWTVGFLFAGLVEHAIRSRWDRLPTVPDVPSWLSVPASSRDAAAIATGGGLLHAAAMTWFAVRLGVSVSGGFAWAIYAFGAMGMFVLAAVPLYLLVRRELLAPMTLLTAFVFLDARAEFTASVEDPHALYFGAWFFYLGILLIAAGIEYGIYRVDAARRVRSLLKPN